MPQLLAPAAPQGFHQLTYRSAGVSLAAPRTWTTTPESPPLVTVISSGGAVISLWRYPGAFGATDSHLRQVSRRLIADARRLQPRLRVLGTEVQTVDGHPAVALEVTEPIGSSLQRVRSLHVFTPGAELVLEEYAPPGVFDRVDRQVFGRVSRSLIVLRP